MSAKSLANLRPFKKGKEWTGNAGGRPKSRLQSEAYSAELAKENNAGETNAELIAKQMVAQAKNGKVNAAQHIIESVEGKPRRKLRIESIEPQVPIWLKRGLFKPGFTRGPRLRGGKLFTKARLND